VKNSSSAMVSLIMYQFLSLYVMDMYSEFLVKLYVIGHDALLVRLNL